MILELVDKIERTLLPPSCFPSTTTLATTSDAETVKDLPYSTSSTPLSSPGLDEKTKRFAIVGELRPEEPEHADWNVSNGRRIALLCVFSLATALDMLNVSAMLTTTESIARDMHLSAGNVTWIITAYSMTFSSLMLFAGRLADLFPAQILFELGLFGISLFMLIASFVSNKYAFLILRALQGVCGALTVPSAYHMIVHLYHDKHSQHKALSIVGLTGAVANSLGVVMGGLFALASWRWLFRCLAAIALLGAAIGAFTMPRAITTKPKSQYSKLQLMDLVGAFTLTGCLLLFILGLTSGTTNGWTDVHFIAPFTVSVAMFIAFFLWEAYLPEEQALLPASMWRLPNVAILVFTALSPMQFWGPTQFGMSNYWQLVHGVKPLLASARLLPEGVAALVGGAAVRAVPRFIERPKWTMLVGLLMAVVGLILAIFSNGGSGIKYWQFIFPSFSIGSLGSVITFLAINTSVVQSVPADRSGVAGALVQSSVQIGAIIGLSCQAGLYSRVDNNIADWRGTQYGFYYCIAWISLTALAVLVFYRPQKKSDAEDAEKTVGAAH